MELRWQLAQEGADPQGALFEPLVERHVGKGEYRGMEFLHVNARTIINEVPAASQLPFRYTINTYRGCSHACTYCLAPDTPVLLAEGRTRRIGDLRAGDCVIGTELVGRYRRFVSTPVIARWSTVRPAFRIALADGTVLVASGDHRFLTDRGWKHVTGTECGANRRPHLTTGNSLLGIGRSGSAPLRSKDYEQGYLCGLLRGDATIGHYPYLRKGKPNPRHSFRLALTDVEPLVRARQFLENEQIVTQKFEFAAAVGARQALTAIRTQARQAVERIEEIIAWPSKPTDEWARGFLAGIYDAEGHLGQVVRICNGDPMILTHVEISLRTLGFRCIREPARPNGITNVRLIGGLGEVLRFILMIDPAVPRKRSILGRALKGNGARRVVSVESVGVNIPMVDITTGTGDFVADGVISHNCFARPTHEFLGLNAADDFERRIVVKVNAVERLRAELSPSRWAGDHIAMGTNTDPYQRCEAKYRLTQGVVRELVAARNPFSILTKSTLILRDLDLLAEGVHERGLDVRANFSIGTLDEDVWRATEPGTPHPARRIEAVARLSAAGVPCGVLVAPILPGLSDRPDQLEAVVEACVDAGAASITPILLHLRPGVREHYLGWLAGARPDLLPSHEELYPRSYAPTATQKELSRRVASLVAKHGGRTLPPRETRTDKPRPAPRPRRTRARQLDLEI